MNSKEGKKKSEGKDGYNELKDEDSLAVDDAEKNLKLEK